MKIKINEPCDADWNKMKIGLKSRHCELCVKNVMDFTQMNREEILLYLFQNKSQSTCARMYGNQIDFKIADLEAVIEGTRKQKGNQPFLILTFATMAMMSCGGESNSGAGMGSTLGEVLPRIEIDSAVQTVVDANPSDSTISKGKIETSKKSKVCLPTAGGIEIETGEIVPFSEPDIVGELIEIHEPEVDGGIMIENFPLIEDTIVSGQHDEVVSVAEIMPEYIGGIGALLEFLETNTNYPKSAKKKEIEGKVYVQFVVEKNGEITSSKVLRGLDPECDQEALRVVNSMPNWIPGTNQGKKVRVKYVLPFNFKLK